MMVYLARFRRECPHDTSHSSISVAKPYKRMSNAVKVTGCWLMFGISNPKSLRGCLESSLLRHTFASSP